MRHGDDENAPATEAVAADDHGPTAIRDTVSPSDDHGPTQITDAVSPPDDDHEAAQRALAMAHEPTDRAPAVSGPEAAERTPAISAPEAAERMPAISHEAAERTPAVSSSEAVTNRLHQAQRTPAVRSSEAVTNRLHQAQRMPAASPPDPKRTKLGVAVGPDHEPVHHEPVDLDAVDHSLVATLRALPPEGTEPDWRRLEAAIRSKTATLRTPTLWWRNWRWLAPIGALALSATIGVVLGMRDDAPARIAVIPEHLRDASVEQDPTVRERRESRDPAAERAPAMWLDGEPVELDEIEPAQLDVELERATVELEHAAGSEIRAAFDDSEHATGEAGPASMTGGLDEAGVLPPIDYRWIDSLDDDAAARIETWLARTPT